MKLAARYIAVTFTIVVVIIPCALAQTPALVINNGTGSGDITQFQASTNTVARIASSGDIFSTSTSNQLVLGTGLNLTTLNFPAPAGAVTLNFPNVNTTLLGNTFPMTISGTTSTGHFPYFSNATTLSNNSNLDDGVTTASTLTYIGSGGLSASRYSTGGNCTSSTGSCGTFAAGSFSVSSPNQTLIVTTTAVTGNSSIIVIYDESAIVTGVTCNIATFYPAYIIARSPGSSFTVKLAAAVSGNPACFDYFIVN